MNIYIHISIMITGYRGQENQALNYREKKHINVFFFLGGGKTTTNNSGGRVYFLILVVNKLSRSKTISWQN